MVHDEGLKKEKLKIILGGFEFDELNETVMEKKGKKSQFSSADILDTRWRWTQILGIWYFCDTF